jgi:hypothetical protein
MVVDEVYKSEGEKLWPDPYDYRDDGTNRLTRQLAAKSPDATTRAAGKWRDLEAIIGRKSLAPLFAAWQKAAIDPANAEEKLGAELVKISPDKREALEAWAKDATPLLVETVAFSPFSRATIDRDKLTGKPTKLAQDDNAPDGKRSIAGGAHARQFTAPADHDDWLLTAVYLHAARYGAPRGPEEKLDLALCDDQHRVIARFRPAYAAIPAGRNAAWVRLETTPTRVPPTFRIVANFQPTATSGVFVSYDSSTSGNSFSTPAGKPAAPFAEGDWMIRVELDRPKGN